jgi:superfamily II DNA or RNA helicase
VLSPFNYHSFKYVLNDEEAAEIAFYMSMTGSSDLKWTDDFIATMCAKVHGKAVDKRKKLIEFLSKGDNINYIRRSFFFFIHHEDYHDEIMPFLNKNGNFRAVDGNTSDKEAISDFKKGKLDGLCLCNKASEGISINDLRSIFLLNTDAKRIKTIQRLGRALRIDEKNKERANIFDFILDKGDDKTKDSDYKRREWLTEMAKISPND